MVMSEEHDENTGLDFAFFTSEELIDAGWFEATWQSAWQAYPDLGAMVLRYVERATQSLEGLAQPDAIRLHDILRKYPSMWHWVADWWYTKEAVEIIPGLVERFLKLSPVLAGRTPSKAVNTYLREATRCFLYGFFQASIALSRAALEAGVNDHLKWKLLAVPEVDLVEKINQAARFNLLSSHNAVLANEVRTSANAVLHEQPATEQLSFDTLVKARGILLELYAE